MHTIENGHTRVHFNSDFSGDAIIHDDLGGGRIEVPALELINIVSGMLRHSLEPEANLADKIEPRLLGLYDAIQVVADRGLKMTVGDLKAILQAAFEGFQAKEHL